METVFMMAAVCNVIIFTSLKCPAADVCCSSNDVINSSEKMTWVVSESDSDELTERLWSSKRVINHLQPLPSPWPWLVNTLCRYWSSDIKRANRRTRSPSTSGQTHVVGWSVSRAGGTWKIQIVADSVYSASLQPHLANHSICLPPATLL